MSPSDSDYCLSTTSVTKTRGHRSLDRIKPKTLRFASIPRRNFLPLALCTTETTTAHTSFPSPSQKFHACVSEIPVTPAMYHEQVISLLPQGSSRITVSCEIRHEHHHYESQYAQM